MARKSWILCLIEQCGQEDEIIEALGAENIADALIAAGAGLSIEYTIGAETGGDTRAVTAQVVDASGENVAAQYSFWMWLSDTAAAAVTADAPSGGTSATTGTILQEHATDVSMDVLTDVNGTFVLSVVEAADDTWFLNARLPDGTVVSSAAITFAP